MPVQVPRIWMKMTPRAIALPANPPPFRHATPLDAPLLAPLMGHAYRGTIDDEGETPEQCLEEVRATLTGKYGPFLDYASFLTEVHGRALSASLVTCWQEKPLLAFSMTLPGEQRKGYASFLIRRSIDALASRGHEQLCLVVTEGNPAERLYASLGFVKLNPGPVAEESAIAAPPTAARNSAAR